MKFIVFGVALVAMAIMAIIMVVRRDSLAESGQVTARAIMFSVLKISGVLLLIGAVLMVIGLAMTGFDWSKLNVVTNDFIVFGSN